MAPRGGSALIRRGSAARSAPGGRVAAPGVAAAGAAPAAAPPPSRAARGFVISDDLELIRRREGLDPTKVEVDPTRE